MERTVLAGLRALSWSVLAFGMANIGVSVLYGTEPRGFGFWATVYAAVGLYNLLAVSYNSFIARSWGFSE